MRGQCGVVSAVQVRMFVVCSALQSCRSRQGVVAFASFVWPYWPVVKYWTGQVREVWYRAVYSRPRPSRVRQAVDDGVV